MATPDGSIHIDTKINAAGVNQGTQQVGKAVEKNISKPVQGLTKSLGGILSIIKTIGKALIAAFVGGAILNAIKGVVGQFDILGSSVGEKFQPLVDALATLKGAFVNLIVQALIPLIPYIVSAVQWFTTMLQTVTQIVAALFGFKQTVGNIMTTAAANAKKAAKEAKGALAAFDQINVLQKQEAPEAPTGPTATPGPLTISEDAQRIADAILKTIQEIKGIWEDILAGDFTGAGKKFLDFVFWEEWKKFFKGLWAEILKRWEATDIGGWIAKLRENFIASWRKIIANAIETLQGIKENVIVILHGIKEFLIGVFTGDWQRAWEGLKDIVAGTFGALETLLRGILEHISLLIEGVGNGLRILLGPALDWLQEKFGTTFDAIKNLVASAWARIQVVWGGFTAWFTTHVFAPIANGFGSMLTDIKLGFETVFNGIKGFIKGVINTIIDYMNDMIQGIVFGINTVIGAANAIGDLVGLPELSSVTAPIIPRLATGAVIPPGAEFLAVLGDQKSGRNIEAPEGLIRQLLREEMGNIRAEIQLEFTGSMAQLVRQLQPHIKKENVRIGKTLLSSGTVK